MTTSSESESETTDRVEEFAFNYRDLEAAELRDKIRTFESWILTEALVGSDSFKEIEALTQDFSDVRIGMTINGKPFNPEPLFRNIWMNLTNMSERAVIARLAAVPELQEIQDTVQTFRGAIMMQMEKIAEERLGTSLSAIMDDYDNPFRPY